MEVLYRQLYSQGKTSSFSSILLNHEWNRKIPKYPLRLPVGTYNVIYWGYPDYFGTAGDAYLADPTLIIGKN